MQLTLQTSLSDIQHHVDSPTPDKAISMGSLSSERQFLSNSHLLSVHAPVLSRSNPTVSSYRLWLTSTDRISWLALYVIKCVEFCLSSMQYGKLMVDLWHLDVLHYPTGY